MPAFAIEGLGTPLLNLCLNGDPVKIRTKYFLNEHLECYRYIISRELEVRIRNPETAWGYIFFLWFKFCVKVYNIGQFAGTVKWIIPVPAVGPRVRAHAVVNNSRPRVGNKGNNQVEMYRNLPPVFPAVMENRNCNLQILWLLSPISRILFVYLMAATCKQLLSDPL
jgi:hypothetical protein